MTRPLVNMISPMAENGPMAIDGENSVSSKLDILK